MVAVPQAPQMCGLKEAEEEQREQEAEGRGGGARGETGERRGRRGGNKQREQAGGENTQPTPCTRAHTHTRLRTGVRDLT